MEKLAKDAGSGLEKMKTTLDTSASLLTETAEKVNQAAEKLDTAAQDGNVETLKNVLGSSPEVISSFVSAPVRMQTKALYPVENYGSAMAPFYSTLSIWVGGIILVAMMKVTASENLKRALAPLKPHQIYLGRYLLFLVLGLIQSGLICLGDLYFLGIQCEHPFLFLLAGWVSSVVYVNIIYALSITFKHIGKAVSVILVIIQIPGSAGTYPIEMTPAFFQKLHPLLPFTYGINAMREAVAGIYGFHYAENLLCLAVYVPIALLIGVVVRPWLLNLNHMFDQKLGETELMICEEEGLTKERFRMTAVVSALADKKTFREEMYQRAERFERNYKKRIRRGFAAILIIPLIFLILMFSISSKMVFWCCGSHRSL